jgi:hypothetical protein
MVVAALPWHFSAKLVPLSRGHRRADRDRAQPVQRDVPQATATGAESLADHAQHEVEQKIHMDLTSDTAHLPERTIVERAGRFLATCWPSWR